jgi:F0F1-type ATP synthase assembly protein I
MVLVRLQTKYIAAILPKIIFIYNIIYYEKHTSSTNFMHADYIYGMQ